MTALGSDIDTIKDFKAADFISIFGNLPAAENFRLGTVAVDAKDLILYDKPSGALCYDADGSGEGLGAVQFATLWSSATTHPPLAAADFVVS